MSTQRVSAATNQVSFSNSDSDWADNDYRQHSSTVLYQTGSSQIIKNQPASRVIIFAFIRIAISAQSKISGH
ncbi:MAG: hypothetical protein HYV42_00350 [Candidatus Magasanikbacteria bacterium]|nr:hypothetical protein [Candidatus Magasanikbacteria bacterium]